MRLLPALVVVGLIVASGCVGPLGRDPICADPEFWAMTGPLTADGDAQRSPGLPGRVLAWARSTLPAPATVDAYVSSPGDDSVARTLLGPANQTVEPGGTRFVAFAVTEEAIPERSTGGVVLAATQKADDECVVRGLADVTIMFDAAETGDAVEPGAGALVHTAGFWRDNGTLFYTNMDRVHNDTRFDRAGWYEYGGGDPLKVYVYNESREERPPRYEGAGYATTIEGFNEALKSMVTTAGAIADIPPEQGYTRPEYAGNDTADPHVLYGDALVFWIEVVEVTSVPCPIGVGPVCETPDVPPTRA